MTSKPPPHFNTACMVFIGGIPYDMKTDQFNEEVDKWPGIVQRFYKGETTGWGRAHFRSTHDRDKFLKDKNKHVLGNKVVDVKPFKWEDKPKQPVAQPARWQPSPHRPHPNRSPPTGKLILWNR